MIVPDYMKGTQGERMAQRNFAAFRLWWPGDTGEDDWEPSDNDWCVAAWQSLDGIVAVTWRSPYSWNLPQ